MAKFKDKATGNVFEFSHPHDIEMMKHHPEYEEVVQEVKEKPSKKQIKQEEV